MKKASGTLELHSKPAGGFTSASGFRCAEQSCAHFSEHHVKILINTLGRTKHLCLDRWAAQDKGLGLLGL